MIVPRAVAIDRLNELCQAKTPFVIFTDFLGENAWIKPEIDIVPSELKFDFPNKAKSNRPNFSTGHLQFQKDPVDYITFKKAFDQVMHQLQIGNSYLTNLTFRTPIYTNLSFDQIFDQSTTPYRIKYKEKFVVFSPETFIRIEGNIIYSYPMKGTIDASIPHAESLILSDHKEMSEHVTIVDLIRNDLSQIASQVTVSKFRFLSELVTSDKTLLQVSSEISGQLHHPSQLGTNLFRLLPAGSISGAPKKQTVAIIQKNENVKRGFFTGICGYFDGEVFDSGVMIRFIEKSQGQLYFRSGGGITALSEPEKEYQEMIDKVYVQIS